MELTTNPYAYVDRSAKLENGEEIQADEEYTLLSYLFNVQNDGGDDFKTVFSQGVIQKDTFKYEIFENDLEAFLGGMENKTYHMKDFTDN